MAISDYSTTPASNTSISGVSIAEGCVPGNINDAIRQMMADIATDAVTKTGTQTLTNKTLTAPTITAISTDTITTSGLATLASALITGLTASKIVGTDGSKNLVSVNTTGTGSAVLATSPSITTPDIVGTATNDASAEGSVGEQLTATASGVSLSAGVDANAANLSLTAGDWEVGGWINFIAAASTSITRLYGSLNTTSATTLASQWFSAASAAFVPGAIMLSYPVPTIRLSLATTTTVYLCAGSIFTASTMTCGGTIRARRVR